MHNIKNIEDLHNNLVNLSVLNNIQNRQTSSATRAILEHAQANILSATSSNLLAAKQRCLEPTISIVSFAKNVNNLYLSVFKQALQYEELYNHSIIAFMQNSTSAARLIKNLNIPFIQSTVKGFSSYNNLSEIILKNIRSYLKSPLVSSF